MAEARATAPRAPWTRPAITLVACLAGAGGASLLAPSAAAHEVVLEEGLRALLDANGGLTLTATAKPGDGWWSLAQRAARSAECWPALRSANGGAAGLRAGQTCTVPEALWPDGLGARALAGIFPADAPHDGGWRHVVTDGRVLGRAESPWALAKLFTDGGGRHAALGLSDAARARGLRPGDIVTIPRELLRPALRPLTAPAPVPSRPPAPAPTPAPVAGASPTPAPAAPPPTSAPATDGAAVESAALTPQGGGQDADMTAVEEGGTHDEPTAAPPRDDFAVAPGSRSDDGTLSYDSDEQGAFAGYRLKPRETLYSNVVMRFTALLSGRDVNAAALRFARRSDIVDVTNIPAGRLIKIPLADLTPEHLPKGHPRRQAWEAELLATDRLAKVERRRNLAGVHVILDSGHGGSDPGAVGARAWEDDFAYDIACRVMAVLRERTLAVVHPLVKDKSSGHAPLSRIQRDTDEVLLSTPPLRLDSGEPARVAVNLRWVIANDRRRLLLAEGVPEDRMVFLSIHADSLHESAKGAMAYYPSRTLRLPRASVPAGASYAPFAEVQEQNAFSMSAHEMLRSEGLSRRLGESILASVRRAGLEVHPYQPVRGQIVRGRPMVPAVLRYNRIPAAVLLEACNLNNAEDQRRLRDPAHRQRFAAAVVDGLVGFFDGTPEQRPARKTSK